MKKRISIVLILVIVFSSLAFAERESIKLEVNKEELKLDVEATMVEGEILLPVRAVFESLGFQVTWDGTSRTVTGKSEDILIKLAVDKPNAMVNEALVKLDTPTLIINQRVLASAKFIEEATGAKVNWDEARKTISINKSLVGTEKNKETLTYSNLVDKKSQDEVRKAMKLSGIPSESIDFFFEEVDDFNSTVENKTLVEDGFITIDSLEPDYDLLSMLEMWDAKYPEFIGYNCRIVSYDLMKDSISIGKTHTSNSDWMVFDKNALENNPKDIFNQKQYEEFQSLYGSIDAEDTNDISVHLENVKEDWKSKEIEFANEDKRSIISVFFHDFEDYLFIGHMGVLIPSEDGKLLFIEKLSFQAPYQAIKFDNRLELNDYLMNKYDISWGQDTARPFIMENDQLLEGYRENQNKKEGVFN